MFTITKEMSSVNISFIHLLVYTNVITHITFPCHFCQAFSPHNIPTITVLLPNSLP